MARFGIILIAICMVSHGFAYDNYMQKLSKDPKKLQLIKAEFPEFVTDQYFTQKFDHFNPSEDRTYQQRYHYSEKFFDNKIGPIFVFICGEAECNVPHGRLFPYALAQEHSAAFYLLEHRYYGKSQLFEDWSTKNMKLLTVENALADLAEFITAKQEEYMTKYNTPKRKVITFGGSYPGALSAWFRLKYPHITDGSIASSGVVQATYEFPQFDQQVIDSMKKSPGCIETASEIVKYVESEIYSGDDDRVAKIYKIFSAGKDFDKADFMGSITQTFGGNVQYGKRQYLCSYMGLIKDYEMEKKLETFAKLSGEAGEDGISDVQGIEIEHTKNMRQWTYQVCTQMGFLFVPSKDSVLTSQKQDLQYWLDYCKRAFGEELRTRTGINEMNLLFGATDLVGSNIFFTNGVEDGWKWASVRDIKLDGTSMTAHVIDCDDCAHCVDLHDETDDDADDLKATRSQQRKHINRWLQSNGFPEDSQAQIRTSPKVEFLSIDA